MAIINWKKGANLDFNPLPDFVREDFENYTRFVKLYKQTKDEGVRLQIVNFLLNRDVDLTEDQWLDLFHDEYAIDFPKKMLESRRLVYKYMKDFYRAKGSEQATRFLFRILFGEEIEFYYPGTDIFRWSRSKWIVNKSLIIYSSIGSDIFSIREREIIGNESGAKTKVDNIVSYVDDNNAIVYELYYSSVSGDFIDNEAVFDSNRNFVGTIKTLMIYPGFYTSVDGHYSSNKRIQDNFYYQEYSYVIKSSRSLDDYKSLLLNLVHPAGTKVFGQLNYTINLNYAIKAVPEPHTLRYQSVALTNLAPTIWSSVIEGETGNQLLLQIQIDRTDINTSIEYFVFATALSGTVSSSTSGSLNDVGSDPITKYAHWTPDDFTNGCGLIGTGTSFLSQMSANTNIKIVVGSDYEYNICKSVDSNTTMTVKYVPYVITIINGTIYK